MLNKDFLNKVKTVLHLGACHGEELSDYEYNGLSSVVFVEANPELIPALELKCSLSKIRTKIYNKAVCEKSGIPVKFNIIYSSDQSNKGCSSLLNLKKHAEYYPHITKTKEITCESIDIDTIVQDCGDFDLLNMDLQGGEMLALKGCSNLNFKYIYTEVSFEELYEGCCMFDEMKSYLESKGYEFVELFKAHSSWGDALFRKLS